MSLPFAPDIGVPSRPEKCWRCRSQVATRTYNGIPYCRRCFYKNHLNSSYWERLYREKRYAVAGRCERCGEQLSSSESRRRYANLHHVSYANLGHESLDDVEFLCRDCHEEHHSR